MTWRFLNLTWRLFPRFGCHCVKQLTFKNCIILKLLFSEWESLSRRCYISVYYIGAFFIRVLAWLPRLILGSCRSWCCQPCRGCYLRLATSSSFETPTQSNSFFGKIILGDGEGPNDWWWQKRVFSRKSWGVLAFFEAAVSYSNTNYFRH